MRREVGCDFVDIQKSKRAFALSFCGGQNRTAWKGGAAAVYCRHLRRLLMWFKELTLVQYIPID